MTSESISKFRESIPVVRGQLGDLKEKLQEVLAVINSGKLVSDAMADSVAESLKVCREKETVLRSLASELKISLEDQSLDQIVELADRAEKEMSLDGLRQVVFDYFRLTTTAQDTLDVLEETKKEFQKVCRLDGDEFYTAFEPYSRLVAHTKSQKDLSDADYDLISDNLGKKLVRAADRKQLSVDGSADISVWLDGSSDLLQKQDQETLTAPVLDAEMPADLEVQEEESVIANIAAESVVEQVTESVQEPVEEPAEAAEDKGDSSVADGLPASVAVEETNGGEKDPSLLGIVDTVNGKVRIRIEKDAPASEAKSSKFTSRAKSQRGPMVELIALMGGLHLHPVVNEFESVNHMDCRFSKYDVDYLLSHGYLGIVNFIMDGKEQKYYALSSKAYACLKKADVVRYFKQNPPKNTFSLPFANDYIPLASWSALFAYRSKLIVDFFLRMETKYPYDLRRGEPLSDYAYAPRIDKHNVNRIYATGVIPEGDPEGVVPFLADYIIKDNDTCELVLILEDLKEIARIREMFRSNYENLICKLRFSLVSEPDRYYDAMGNLIDGSDENEKEAEKPVDGEKPKELEYVHPKKPVPKLELPSNVEFQKLIEKTGKLLFFLYNDLSFQGFMDERYVVKNMIRRGWYREKETVELLDYLEGMGYISRYEYEGRIILCFTELMQACLNRNSLHNLIKRRFNIKKASKCSVCAKQDMEKSSFIRHLQMTDLYIDFKEKYNGNSSLTEVFATAFRGDPIDRYGYSVSFMVPETHAETKVKLFIVSPEEFMDARTLPKIMGAIICYFEKLPELEIVDENRLYMSLLPDGLYYMDEEGNWWPNLAVGGTLLASDDSEENESVSSGDTEEMAVNEETEKDMTQAEPTDLSSSADTEVDSTVNSAEKDLRIDSISGKAEMEKQQEPPKKQDIQEDSKGNSGIAIVKEEKLSEKNQENDEYYYSKALEAFCADKPEVGMTLLHTLDQKPSEMPVNAERYGYALGDPMTERDNRYHYLHRAFSDPFGETFAYDVLAAAAYLRHYFSPTVRQDPYTVGNLDFLKGNLLLNESVETKNLFYRLSQFVAKQSRGLDDNLLGMAVKNVGRNEQIAELCQTAKDWIAEKDNCSCSKTSIVQTRKEIFENDGDFVRLMKIVAGNNKEQIGEARKMIRRFYSNGGVDFDALDEYIKPIAVSHEGVSYQSLVQSDWVYLRREISKPVEIVGQWIDLVDNKYVEKENLITDASELIETCKPFLETVSGTVFDSEKEDSEIHAACQIFRFTAKCLLKRLDGDDTQERYKHYFYINLLREPLVALDDSYIPLIEKPDEEIAEYDMCKRTVQYLDKKTSPWKETVDRIFNFDQEHRCCYDFGCARLLKDYLKATDQIDQWGNYDIEARVKTLNSVSKKKQSPNYWEEEFIANLELAKSDDWLESTQSIERLVDIQSALYKTNRNFGFFGRALLRMLDNIRAQAAGLKPGYEKRLQDKLEDLDATARKLPVFDRIRDAIDKLRFTEADSFLTQVENGNLDISMHDQQALGNTFASFMDEYRHYYDDSLNSRHKKLVDCYINSHPNKNAVNYKSAVEFLTAWPVETGFVSKEVIRKFVTLLGLPGKDPQCFPKGKNLAIVKFKEEYHTEYDHPIGQFGTRIEHAGMDICIVDCSDDVDELSKSIDEMRNNIKVKKAETPTLLVLVDGSIRLDVRRQLAGKYAKKLNMDPFIIMDRVVALFIAGYGVATRWQQFLRCSLPFQPENPYYSDPLAEIPPEMFFGRVDELQEIITTKVARLVYGGRQLGKTALLHQARNHLKEPLTQRWASYVDVKDKNVVQASEVIGEALQEGSEKFFTVTKRNKWTWNILMNELTSRLTYKEDLQDTFFLIIDEADEFIKSSEQNDYRELDDLINLSNRTNNRFKFVLAGLHNVLRFKNSNNRIASKIPARIIEPLKFDDARELLERPLSYLGFDFSSAEGDVIAQIVHTANYFPGLIHFYAHSLIDSKHKQFNSMITPFYTLNRDDLLRLLQNEKFIELRKDRLEMTLKLNEKEAGYYYTIALLLANLYYSSEGHHYSSHGVSAKELLEYARGYNPNAAVSSLSETDMTVLLDELKKLYILRSVDDGEVIRYKFARRSFHELLGRSKEVDDKLQAIMMGEA